MQKLGTEKEIKKGGIGKKVGNRKVSYGEKRRREGMKTEEKKIIKRVKRGIRDVNS